ncbi:MAG: AraC family transcriptional regulator [Bacteroidota bacterium]|nr:AraC family transcriptional regulator [Bacteroidota bacterium]
MNKYIDIAITRTGFIDNSHCFVYIDDDILNMFYYLSSNDCLIDMLNYNYELKIKIKMSNFTKYNETFQFVPNKHSLCCNTQSKLIEIINCNLSGFKRNLFLESNILYLLVQLNKTNSSDFLECEKCNFLNTASEIEKIQEAKQYILDNLANNLTIPIIALTVGTNQCYLKKGFKEVFKQTIFEFIQENRMVKAKHLLLTEKYSITDIAASVGYSSLSSFSQSYKNYFGISPTKQTKQTIPNF